MKTSLKIEQSMIIILIILLSISIPNLITSKAISNNQLNKYSYTIAICDEKKYCEDYYVECYEKQLTKLTPTGFTIQKKSNWKDKRSKTELCN